MSSPETTKFPSVSSKPATNPANDISTLICTYPYIMDRIPASFNNDPIFRKLGKVARYGTLSESQRRAYDHSLKVYRDNYAIAQTERSIGRAEGRAEGLAEGRAEGLAEGRAEGLVKGRAEGRAEGRVEGKAEVVINMLKNGADLEFVAKMCNLSKDEIEKIIDFSKS